MAGVQFLVDGAALGAEDTSSPYGVSWNTTTAANGTHTLTARARDAAGNTTTSTAVTVTVNNPDTTAPTVSVTAPANGATVSGTVTLSATASDNVGVAGVQFLLDGTNAGRRGHQLALRRVVEHHHGHQRHPHADRSSPRRRRQHHHLGGR